MSGGSCSPCILHEQRESSKLVTDEIPLFLEGKDYTEMKRKLRNRMLQDFRCIKDCDLYYLERAETFERASLKSLQYMKAVNKHGVLDLEERTTMRDACNQLFPCDLHENLFIPTIMGQASQKQKAKWLPLANNFSIIGAYAQTELGHGSNVQDLETTASYDSSTQEFILNTPTLTSIKWWPGSMGHVATHATVMARLLTRGEDHGVHLFLVQLRSLENHKPFHGIKIGDVGPCLGLTSTNNGFLSLTNVRIPREQMLMKHAQVFADGTYYKPIVNKINYGPMINTRVLVAFQAAVVLSKAVVIATRSNFIQQQSGVRLIPMDYKTQQHKLLPLLATVFAFYTTGEYILALNEQATSQFDNNLFDLLPELHATVCGLKAFMTHIASNGIEVCRLACEIHGYSLASSLPTLYGDSTVYQTLEGENTVLLLQTARFLKKQYNKQLPQSQLPGNITYVAVDYTKSVCTATIPEHFSDSKVLLDAYRQRARTMIEIASLQYQDALEEGLEDSEAWNASSIDWINAAQGHCHYVVLKAFSETLNQSALYLSPANLLIIKALLSLFAVSGIEQYYGQFMMSENISTSQLVMARQHLYSLLTVVKQEAVPLVDGLDFPDELLNGSILGRYDGDNYTNLYDWAKKAPRNRLEVHNSHLNQLINEVHSKL